MVLSQKKAAMIKQMTNKFSGLFCASTDSQALSWWLLDALSFNISPIIQDYFFAARQALADSGYATKEHPIG